ncbi:hypothetical protein HPB48_001636 [Haemaphysalis longicornis]|uniref:Uncharacterized protein n=1 Tax=Haemaphysalis longicornis TaxID=44386 RepID=A0A9J6FYK8_HAELO|nr:hypothetical protein HPB48_001636 [Haemaphysalis longicornis]
MIVISVATFCLFRLPLQQVGDTTAEDAHSVEGHIKAMKQEMKKAVPNEERLRDSMARTFESRRQYIAEERPLLRDLFERYPALASKEEVKRLWVDCAFYYHVFWCAFQIFREFERLGGHSPLEALTHVANTHMNALLDVAGNRVEARTHEILDKARESSTEDQEGENAAFPSCCRMLLPVPVPHQGMRQHLLLLAGEALKDHAECMQPLR